MNQRIKELMEEAGLYDFVIESMGINEEMNKFAELIVKECTRSIENTIETDCITDGEKMGCEFAILDLLKHFGVEE
jgi:hypothetical protein